jgi:hypothetical protein
MRVALFLLLSGLAEQDASRAAAAALPEGNKGIAAKYLLDAGLERDPGIVFADDFDSGRTKFENSWGGVVFTDQPENVHGGKKAMECVLPWPRAAREVGMGVGQRLKEGYDTLHLRYYAKFGKTTELYHGGTHNGGSIFARAPGVPDAKPGIPADGRNDYTALLDTWRPDDKVASPGTLAVYCYHPEQRHQWGEHFFASGKMLPYGGPSGYFGPGFVSRPDLVPERDRWICYELMVKANTPGKRDGRIAFWIDGKLAADFQNLRLRDVDALKANRVSLGLYTKNEAIKGPCSMWYDDVAVATSYIGPVTKRSNLNPEPRKAADAEKKESPVRKAASPEALAAWDGKLRERIRGELLAGRRPRFRWSAVGDWAEVVELGIGGELRIGGKEGGASLAWASVALEDRRNLALGMLQKDRPADHALAAFYLLATGEWEKAQSHLEKAGPAAEEALAAFR